MQTREDSMGRPEIAAAILARLTEIVGSRATAAPGVVAQHGRSEAYHASAPPDIVVFPETTKRML
jgi:D-lactate dehydrogenase (cytochrome)